MTETQKHKGLIRMALMGTAFIALTVVLIVFQPGSPRKVQNVPVPDASVTRVAPALDTIETTPAPATAHHDAAQLDTERAARSVPQTNAPEPDSMRDLTFTAISNLKSATTGEAPAPGQPGSLLHSVVQRSLGVTPQAQSPEIARTETTVSTARVPKVGSYFVRPGDTLISIAQELYGDADMAARLFEANTDVMARPDSLRPGMVLEVPSP